MTTISSNTDVLVKIRKILNDLLGAEENNLIGRLKVIYDNGSTQEIPAIEIRYGNEPNPLKKEMISGSGLRVIILEQPDIIHTYAQGHGTIYDDYYTVKIENHHPRNSLNQAIRLIVSQPLLYVDRNGVRIKNAVIGDSGATPAECLIPLRFRWYS